MSHWTHDKKKMAMAIKKRKLNRIENGNGHQTLLDEVKVIRRIGVKTHHAILASKLNMGWANRLIATFTPAEKVKAIESVLGKIMVGMILILVGSIAASAQGLPTGTAHSVTLLWTAPSPVGGSGTVLGYNVYRSLSTPVNYSKVNVGAVTALTYVDTSVSGGTAYSYCITTVDTSSEESACSVPVAATTPTNPNAPGTVTVTIK